MSNYTVSNIGQNAGSGSTTANFLKVFAGEVITAFETANSTLDKHLVRTISSGKSAQFPIVGKYLPRMVATLFRNFFKFGESFKMLIPSQAL